MRVEDSGRERFCTLVQRLTCGVHVVNNNHSLESTTYPDAALSQRERLTDVGGACGTAQPALAGAVTYATEQRSIGEPGVPCKPPRERLGRVETALPPMVTVGRHRGDDESGGVTGDNAAGGEAGAAPAAGEIVASDGERRSGEPCHLVGQRAQRAELAGSHEGARRALVAEASRGRRKGELAVAAFGTRRAARRRRTHDRPPASAIPTPTQLGGAQPSVVRTTVSSGSSAASAAPDGERAKTAGAGFAEPGPGGPADDAAFGKDEVEKRVQRAGRVHS